MGSEGVLTIVLGDRHPLFQEAVRSVLEGEPGLRVVATAGNGNHAVAEAEHHRPNVALLSANLQNCDGFSATALIRSRVPTCRVLHQPPWRHSAPQRAHRPEGYPRR